MFLSNPSFVLAILAASSFLTLSVSAQNFVYYGGYPATTDVAEVAAKDLIQKKLESILKVEEGGDACANVVSAKEYYLNGDGEFLKDLPTYTKSNSLIKNMYEDYYEEGYATSWVTAALSGSSYRNNDFGDFAMTSPCVGQQESGKKGTAYLGGNLEVNQYMEKASKLIDDDCINQLNGCTEATEAWNEAAAFFVGSLEGRDGLNVDEGGKQVGKQLFALGDKRCANYNKCGINGDEGAGVAKTNLVIINLFQKGAGMVFSGDQDGLQKCIKEINNQILITFIQGTLRYAHKLAERDTPVGDLLAKEMGEGATFAASALPQLWAISKGAADIVEKMFKIGPDGPGANGELDFEKVHLAFACNYPQMGISCSEIGGLDDGVAAFEPCPFEIEFKSACDKKPFSLKGKFKKGICKKYIKKKNKKVFTRGEGTSS